MTNDAAVIVEDLFLTDAFLIKGRVANKYQRLVKVLEDGGDAFLEVHDASMISLRGTEVIRTPSVLVNPNELVLAHEFVDVAGDNALRGLAGNQKPSRIRAFYNGPMQLELTGCVEARAYEPSHGDGKRFFIMQEPTLRGIDLDANAELSVLKDLSYAIVRKSKLAYIYDFS